MAETRDATQLKQVDIPEIGTMILQHGYENLPWQMDGLRMARLSPPYEAYCLESTGVVVVPTGTDGLLLNAVIVPKNERLQGYGRRILQAIAQKYPDRNWRIPQISPDEADGFFQKLGFVRHELNQFQMEIQFTK